MITVLAAEKLSVSAVLTMLMPGVRMAGTVAVA